MRHGHALNKKERLQTWEHLTFNISKSKTKGSSNEGLLIVHKQNILQELTVGGPNLSPLPYRTVSVPYRTVFYRDRDRYRTVF